MAKICPACQAENRDEAQFCRTCGTPFPLIPPDPPAPAIGAPCTACGFGNKPGVRYCAKCGVNLMGTVVVPRSQRPQPPAAAAHGVPAYAATASYPPGQTPTYVPPPTPSGSAGIDVPLGADDRDDPHAYPPDGPLGSTGAPDPLHVPDVPDPRLAIEVERAAADELERTVLLRPPVGVGFGVPPAPPPPRRTGLWAGIAVAVVVAAGVAWYFLRSSSEPTRPAQTAPQPAATASAAAPAEPKAAVAEPASSPDAAPTAIAPAASAADTAAALPPADTAASAAPAQAAAPAPTDEERLAAEKRAREKAARERAEREGRTKAAAEQREQAAARQRAEQEAAAAAAAAQQRARQQAAPPPSTVAAPAPAPRARTVAEICGGRNIIAQSVCESRECGSPEHAGEAVCRKVREQEERHREGLR